MLGFLAFVGVLYFASYSKIAKCKTDKINWDIATQALSEHYRNSGSTDFGPADIQRHFEENCENDLKIYSNYMAGR